MKTAWFVISKNEQTSQKMARLIVNTHENTRIMSKSIIRNEMLAERGEIIWGFAERREADYRWEEKLHFLVENGYNIVFTDDMDNNNREALGEFLLGKNYIVEFVFISALTFRPKAEEVEE